MLNLRLKLKITRMKEDSFVVTIGRQFGSGGREIGKKIAESLGIAYFDKELLLEAARKSGFNADLFKLADERTPSFFSRILSFNVPIGSANAALFHSESPISDENIYNIQSNVIEEIALAQPCVIVGRSADYILRDKIRCVNIYICADLNNRIERIIQRTDCSIPEEAIALIQKKDKDRENYYNFYTDKSWGMSSSYDLSINVSSIGIDAAADLIVDFVKQKLKL